MLKSIINKLTKQLYTIRSFKQRLKPQTLVFDKDERGFTLTINTGAVHINWEEIETAFGYKVDCLAFDEICLDIFTKGILITISESTPGWEKFNNMLANNIPTIPPDWIIPVIAPASATNMTLLFDKNQRSKEQAEAELYK